MQLEHRTFVSAACIAAALFFVPACGGTGAMVTSADPVAGRQDALVTVVAFGDYQCPYTARAVATLDTVRQNYRPGKLRVAWKHFPLSFHPAATPAAEAAAAVFIAGGSDPFWELSHRMLASQRELAPGAVERWVSELHIPFERYQTARALGVAAAKVQADLSLALELGVRASPTFFVDGSKLEGAQPVQVFTAAIDWALAQARAEAAEDLESGFVRSQSPAD